MVVLTSDVVYNRLQDIKNPTQEAIETMSLWIMHYKDKASIDLIVDGWLNCFKTAGTDSKRIALFYVMNDVVQKAKMKHADTIIPAFQPAVLTAVGIGRKQEKVKGVMKRCIQIFKSRSVFSSASTTAMEALLDEGYEAEDQALEVDADDLYKKITNFVSARNVITDMMKFVNEGDFDYKEKCTSGMKDREEGAHILQEVHEAIDTMVQVRHTMENQKKKMMALSETLELAKRVFLHQKREVLVVEEAYVNFRDGIKAVHTELSEMEEKGVYPGLLSPPTDEDHMMGYGRNIDNHFGSQSVSWGDNRNQIDMEIDDDERPQAPMMKPALQALVGISSQPSLQSRIMQLGLKKIANGDEEMFQQIPPAAPGSAMSTFQGKPPAPNVVPTIPAGVNQFSVPPPAIPASAPLDPRIRSDGPLSRQLPINLPPPGQSIENQMHVAPPPLPQAVQPSAYQAQFEARDPRFAAGQRLQAPPNHQVPVQQPSTIAGYQAQFEQRDPRMMHQQIPSVAQAGYQNFEAQKQPLVSPQPQSTGYQARFEQSQLSPQLVAQQQANQYHQQHVSGAFNRPPPPQHQPHQQGQSSQSYSDYSSGDRDRREDRYDRRDDRGNGGYHNNRYDDRRKSAPYNNPRGGSDRWRGSGGTYNDRNGRSGGRDNWRGGNSRGGGYNRY